MSSPRYAAYLRKHLVAKIVSFRVIWCEACHWSTHVEGTNTRQQAKRIATSHEKANSVAGHICRVSVEYVRTEKTT
jgi:hypothetical protein